MHKAKALGVVMDESNTWDEQLNAVKSKLLNSVSNKFHDSREIPKYFKENCHAKSSWAKIAHVFEQFTQSKEFF